jgi:hypothetical protein
MKSFLFFLLLSPCVTFGQVYKFKSFATKVLSKGQVGRDATPDEGWNKVDILVVINLGAKKINIYSATEVKLDLVRPIEPYKDKEGNDWIEYTGVDKDGVECNVSTVIFKDQTGPHTATLTLAFSDYNIYYRLKKDD